MIIYEVCTNDQDNVIKFDSCAATSNFEFLHLMFLKHVMDKEAVWLLGVVLEFIWEEILTRRKIVKLVYLVWYTKMKYKSDQSWSQFEH